MPTVTKRFWKSCCLLWPALLKGSAIVTYLANACEMILTGQVLFVSSVYNRRRYPMPSVPGICPGAGRQVSIGRLESVPDKFL